MRKNQSLATQLTVYEPGYHTQRFVQPFRVFAPCLSHVGPPTAVTTDCRSYLTYDVPRVDASLGDVGRNHRKQLRLAVDYRAQNYHARFELVAQMVSRFLEGVHTCCLGPTGEHLYTANLSYLLGHTTRLTPGYLALQRLNRAVRFF